MAVQGPGGLGVFRGLLADPSSSAVLTDFDGTLAPIVRDPETARPLPQAPRVLSSLSESFGVVGVISGRPAAFLAHHLREAGPKVRLAGVYGCEWVEEGSVVRAPEVDAWVPAVSEVLAAARAEAPEGVGIEDKGVSATLHWRRTPEAGSWANGFARSWAARTGLVLQPGRMAIEFRPPVGLDKGSAVEEMARGCKGACFAGDDAGDVAAFVALDRMACDGIATVRIAVRDEESPPELVAAADVVVDGPAEVLRLLAGLADAARRSR